MFWNTYVIPQYPLRCLGRKLWIILKMQSLSLSSTVFVPYQTDVIVNTTGEDVYLSRGAVSRAVLYKAGKEMQAEITKKHSKLAKQALPHVIQTKPYGLLCKQVYHTVCALKGKEGAEKVMLQLKSLSVCNYFVIDIVCACTCGGVRVCVLLHVCVYI